MSKKIGREYKMNEENDKNNKQIHIWVDEDACPVVRIVEKMQKNILFR